MLRKTPADELVEFRNILKAPARAVHGNKSTAVFDEQFQVLPMGGIDLFVVRIEKDDVEEVEIFRVTESGFGRGDVVKVDRIAAKAFCQHREVEVALVKFRIVPHEENADRSISGAGVGRKAGKASAEKDEPEKRGGFHGGEKVAVSARSGLIKSVLFYAVSAILNFGMAGDESVRPALRRWVEKTIGRTPVSLCPVGSALIVVIRFAL